jgi:hypothetical protein
MAPVMPHQHNPNAIGQFAVNEVIWETFQIRAMRAGFDQVKPAGLHCRHVDESAQLRSPNLCETSS